MSRIAVAAIKRPTPIPCTIADATSSFVVRARSFCESSISFSSAAMRLSALARARSLLAYSAAAYFAFKRSGSLEY